MQGGNGRIADGRSGMQPSTRTGYGSFGIPALVDLDGDGTTNVYHDGPITAGPKGLDIGLTALWRAGSRLHSYGAALPIAGGEAAIATAAAGGARFDLFGGADGRPIVSVALAGGLEFTDEAAARAAGVVPGIVSSPVAVDDLTGSGLGAFLYGAGRRGRRHSSRRRSRRRAGRRAGLAGCSVRLRVPGDRQDGRRRIECGARRGIPCRTRDDAAAPDGKAYHRPLAGRQTWSRPGRSSSPPVHPQRSSR